MSRLAILATGIVAVTLANTVHAQFNRAQYRQRNDDVILQLGQAANEVMNGIAAMERAKHGGRRVQYNPGVNNGRRQPARRVDYNNGGRPQHQIRIVRVVADPRDYVELQASGMMDLTGYRLFEGQKWFAIPAGTIIRPNERLRIYFFSSKNRNHSRMAALYRQQGRLVADGIGISAGEEIELRAPSGVLVDRRAAPRTNSGTGNGNGVVPVRNNQGGNGVVPVRNNQGGNGFVYLGNNRGGGVPVGTNRGGNGFVPVRNTSGGSSLSRKLVGHWKTKSDQPFYGELILFANHQCIVRMLQRGTGRPSGQIERGQWNVQGDSLVISERGLSITFSSVLVDGDKMDIYWPQTNTLLTFHK